MGGISFLCVKGWRQGYLVSSFFSQVAGSLLQWFLGCYSCWLVEQSRKVLDFFKNQERKIKNGSKIDSYLDLVQVYSGYGSSEQDSRENNSDRPYEYP